MRSIVKPGPRPGAGAAGGPAAVLLPQYTKAREDNDTTKQQALLAICPGLGEIWRPPPVKSPEEQLTAAAQKLRRLQTQQGKIKAQLVAAAQSQKELLHRLSENLEQCLAAQAEVDNLVGKTTVGAATAADQEKPQEETEFPELGAEDLETLGAEGKREYEAAKKAAAEASAALKQAAATGQHAKEAAKRLRKLHKEVNTKRKKSSDGTAQATSAGPENTTKVDEQGVRAENLDFTDPEAVNKCIEATAQFKVKAKAHQLGQPAGNSSGRVAKPINAGASVDRALHVLFANVTHFGEKVRHYVQHTSFDIVGIAEHHLLGNATKIEAMKLRRQGWHSQHTWTPATPTGRSTTGTHGGTCWTARAGLLTSAHLPDATGKSVFQKNLKDISVMIWRRKGVTLALICIYLDSGKGFENENASKMLQLTRVVKSFAVPWVALGDWNNTPEQFANTRWLQALGELLLPADSPFTCTSGKGRLIDYGVCSRNFFPLVKHFKVVRDAPSSPHLGLDLALAARPAAVNIQVPRQPVLLQIPTQKMKIRKSPKRAQHDRELHAKLTQPEDDHVTNTSNDPHDIHRHLLEEEYLKEVKGMTTDDMWME
ncbi:unnamed protein product, partial [Prorocentrum cordatum]